MGTSLSGLTPATTFDGLLKVGDNDPLTSDLKAISDGSGNDSAVQLSTGELKVIGQFNLDSDTAATTINLRGDSLSINQIYQANNVTYNSIVLLNSSGIRLNNGTGTALLARGGNVGIGGITATPTARLQVKGSGTTSATTSLLVQNSAGGNVFSITDDGLFTFNDPGGNDALTIENGNNNSKIRYNDNLWLGSSHGSYAPTLKIDRTAGLSVETNSGSLLNLLYDTGNLGIGETTPTARLHVKGSGNDATTTALLVQNSDASDLLKVADNGDTVIKSNGAFSFQTIAGTKRIEVKANGEVLLKGGQLAAYSNYNSSNSNLIVGSFSSPTARLHVKGSGTTSATTSLLVQNSAGTDVLKVQDDGITTFGQNDQSGSTPTGIEFQPNPLNATWGPSIKSYYNNSKWLQIEKGARYYTFADSGLGINMNATPTAQLQVKGSGTTSATTSLLVQNSAGTEHLKVTDDGVVNVRSTFNVNHITNSSRSLKLGWGSVYATDNASELQIGAVYSQAATAPKITLGGKTRAAGADAIQVQALNGMYIATTANAEDPSAQLHIKGSGNDATTTALLVQNSDGTDILSIKDDLSVVFNSTITSASSTLRFDVGGVGTIRMNSDQVAIGGNTTPTARLHVKGSGTTSATKALLVQKSDGVSILTLKDNGDLTVGGSSDLGVISGGRSRFRFGLLVGDTSSSETSAVLEAKSTTQGFLPPRMTTTERDAISTPAAGLMVYNTTDNVAQCWNGSEWKDMFTP